MARVYEIRAQPLETRVSGCHRAEMPRALTAALVALGLAASLSTSACADWSNLGGNNARNGLITHINGPISPVIRWSGAPNSLIAWTPIVDGSRVFNVRQVTASAPISGAPFDSPVVAMSLETGAVLWTFYCPFATGDWSTVVYGARNGRVFVGRGGNGGSISAPVYCLDAASGKVLWTSTDEVATGAYDGIVFADDGDPIFAWHLWVKRLDAETGATVWTTARSCSVSGDYGPARSGDSIYLDEVGPGGQVISRLNIDTGARLYQSQVMPGFLSQNTPFCAPDPTGAGRLVFYPRTQSNQAVDFLYAYRDTGTNFELLWTAAALAGAGSQHAITPDGGIVMVGFNGKLEVRDQLTGILRHQTAAAVTASINQSHIAVDRVGRIFYGNGGFPGTVTSFSPSLNPRWSINVPNLNQGGPVIADDGSMLIAGTGSSFTVYATPPCVPADLNCDGAVGPADLAFLLNAWDEPRGDLTGDGTTASDDIAVLLNAWTG